MRGRIRRGSVVAHKDDSGVWLVDVPDDTTPHTPSSQTQRTPTYDTATPTPDAVRDMLVDALMSEVDFLRAQLERETVAHAQAVHELHMILADNRRALAATVTTQNAPPRDETAVDAELPLPRTIGGLLRRWVRNL